MLTFKAPEPVFKKVFLDEYAYFCFDSGPYENGLHHSLPSWDKNTPLTYDGVCTCSLPLTHMHSV